MDHSTLEMALQRPITLDAPLIVPMWSRGSYSVAEELGFRVITPDIAPDSTTSLLLKLGDSMGLEKEILDMLDVARSHARTRDGRICNDHKTFIDVQNRTLIMKSLAQVSEDISDLRRKLAEHARDEVEAQLRRDGFSAGVTLEEFVDEVAAKRPFMRHVDVEVPAGAIISFHQDPAERDLNPDHVQVTFENVETGVQISMICEVSDLNWALPAIDELTSDRNDPATDWRM